MVDIVREGHGIALKGGAIPDSTLVSRSVCPLNAVLIASPDYLARHGIPRSPNDLQSHRLIARCILGGKVVEWSFRAADGSISAFNPTDAATQAACDGAGITSVGAHLAWPHLQSGALKVLLHGQHHQGSYEMVMQYPHCSLLPPRVRATLDYLQQGFADDAVLHLPLAALSAYAARRGQRAGLPISAAIELRALPQQAMQGLKAESGSLLVLDKNETAGGHRHQAGRGGA